MQMTKEEGSVWSYDRSGDITGYTDQLNGNVTYYPPITQVVVPENDLPPIMPEVVNEIDLPAPTKKAVNAGAVIGWLILAFVGFKVVTKKSNS